MKKNKQIYEGKKFTDWRDGDVCKYIIHGGCNVVDCSKCRVVGK